VDPLPVEDILRPAVMGPWDDAEHVFHAGA
jgi:hypothetical protein